MPHYLFRIGEYSIQEITEMDDETNAPETLINIDRYGTGSMALHAPDAARAEMYSLAHLRIHRNWNNPAVAGLHLN